ncbi:MAG: pirin family protein [Pseudomonadota bacterium]
MLSIRRADERGKAEFGWLSSRHTFSFGRYFDPNHLGFGPLRVINDDRVAPGGGFGEHGHQDMEIISLVLDGALAHKDSMGEAAVVRPGDIQRMSAGSGVRHSEFNASDAEPVHFLQIWIIPEREGLTPSYEQATIPAAERVGALRLLGSRDGRDGSVKIHRDVDLYGATLESGDGLTHAVAPGRGVWVQMIRGEVHLNRETIREGDGAALTDAPDIRIEAAEDAEFILFDMAL